MRGGSEKRRGERGQALILGALALVVLFGFTAMSVDVGFFIRHRAVVQQAVDAAALAGAQALPDDQVLAEQLAKDYAQKNGVDPATIQVTFRCTSGYNCDGTTTFDTIQVKGQMDVPFFFAPVLQLTGATTNCWLGACPIINSAAGCQGACGAPPTEPLDVVIVIDRTGSMTSADMQNAKDGAKAVLELYDPAKQHVALALLPAGNPANPCNLLDAAAGGVWLAVPLSSDYQNPDGTLNNSSALVSTINCLTDSGRTNLGSPIHDVKFGRPDALNHLLTAGRAGVKKAIIFMTDGEANEPDVTGGAADTGNLNCTANAAVTSSAGDNNGFQTNPGSACTDGSGNATDTNSGTNTSTSCADTGKDKHIFYNYNATIPSGATITGIRTRLDAWVDSASGTRQMCAELSWDGGVTWTSAKTTSSLSSSQSTKTLGGSSDTWGRSWTASDFSNANFRLRITNVGSSTSRDFNLDWAPVTVYYSTPGIALGPCDYANNMASDAKAAEVEIYTIGFGVEGATCSTESGSSPYDGALATQLLADMAVNSFDDQGNCVGPSAIAAENADGDHFLCEARSGDLAPIFQQIASQLAGGSRLVPIQ